MIVLIFILLGFSEFTHDIVQDNVVTSFNITFHTNIFSV